MSLTRALLVTLQCEQDLSQKNLDHGSNALTTMPPLQTSLTVGLTTRAWSSPAFTFKSSRRKS